MTNFLKRSVLIIFISISLTSIRLVNAHNKTFSVDSLTTVIDGDYPPFNQILPGDTLLLEHGHRDFILLCNLKGEANNPVVVTNSHGIVTINTDN